MSQKLETDYRQHLEFERYTVRLDKDVAAETRYPTELPLDISIVIDQIELAELKLNDARGIMELSDQLKGKEKKRFAADIEWATARLGVLDVISQHIFERGLQDMLESEGLN
jgi:hypothetical protein